LLFKTQPERSRVREPGEGISQGVRFRFLVMQCVCYRVSSKLGYRFDQSQMVRFVSDDITRIEGERAQHFVASEQGHGDGGAIGRIRFNLRRIEIEPRVAVVHRLTVGDDPSCYARSENNT